MSDTPDVPASENWSQADAEAGTPEGEGADLDPLDEQEDESFPASDPHSDWAGPAEEVERP